MCQRSSASGTPQPVSCFGFTFLTKNISTLIRVRGRGSILLKSDPESAVTKVCLVQYNMLRPSCETKCVNIRQETIHCAYSSLFSERN